jgi:putative sugar O-methyltransferase
MLKKIVKNILPHFIVRKIQNSRNVKSGVSVDLKTSLTDNEEYPNFCLNAANDLLVFSNFRQNKIYQKVLEHVDVKTGGLYLEEIIRTMPDLINEIEKIKMNDAYGNPIIYDYKTIGKICPSTLRYAKVLADLFNNFNSLDGLKIVEIGVGYGGQCRIINAIAKPAEYTLVDIRPALLLAQTYLDGYVLSSVMKYKTMNELNKETYDLIISNYAFTELKRDIQDVYLEKIILNTKHGYITYNETTPEYFKSYKKDELIKTIPNAKVIEENSKTHENNCIIVW